MTRNYGFSKPANDGRYPEGCDWPKPPGCHCKFIAQAQGCENRCDDSMYDYRDQELSPFWRWFMTVAIVVAVLMIIATVTKAGDVHQLPPVIVEAPAPRPRYCYVLTRFERSCTGVKLAAASLGRAHAETLARKCGATEFEMAEARRCFDPN